jgi:hypothetical protein
MGILIFIHQFQPVEDNITISQFNQLSKFEKYGMLEGYGTYLEISRIEDKCQVALFYLFNFYVEVWLDLQSDQLLNATAFRSITRLDPYLNKIDLSAIRELL